MKKLLLILLCLPMIGFGQQTFVPDDNFESYLESNGMGNGIINDDSVLTSNINTVTYLSVSNESIADLTGLEDFTALTSLHCHHNQLTSLDVSNYITLTSLSCYDNQLTSLDVSYNTALTSLRCHYNQLTNLDVSNNTALTTLSCSNNQLTSLDVSQNTALTYLYFFSNQLTSLDVRNGNNSNFVWLDFTNNSNLTCIDVDDDAWSTTYWTVANSNIDNQHYFSNNCSGTAIEEHTTNKELLKVTDILGKETKQTNQPLFYIYDDGTVEKRIVIE
jgi:Leucine-rich repeat (LRR) protein